MQYPSAGFGGFYAQISAAKRSIDMEMYELSDPVAEQDLVRAASRGVAVRVLLDRDYSGSYVNAAAYAYLHSHGVQVRWAPAHYIFHIKATTFDDRTSDVSTANLTANYYATTRDAEVIDSDPAQVRAIEKTFVNDWAVAPGGAPRGQTVQAPGLIWSPNTVDRFGRDRHGRQIGGCQARRRLRIRGAERRSRLSRRWRQMLAAESLPHRDDGLQRVGRQAFSTITQARLQGARPA